MHDFATVVEHVSLDWIFAKTPRGNRQNLLVLSCAFWISLAAKIYYRGKKKTQKNNDIAFFRLFFQGFGVS